VATRVIGYVRVSTDEQSQSGAGIAAQKAAIAAEAGRRGWEVVQMVEDEAASAKSLERRPGLAAALLTLKRHEAEVLLVSKLDRLTRSLADFANLLARSTKEGWAVAALDVDVDTSTPSGEAMAHIMATFAQLERRLIGQRTKDAMAVKRAEGVRLGAPIAIPADVEARIVRRRAEGASLRAIAEELNSDRIPTARSSARWSHPTIRRVLERQVRGA